MNCENQSEIREMEDGVIEGQGGRFELEADELHESDDEDLDDDLDDGDADQGAEGDDADDDSEEDDDEGPPLPAYEDTGYRRFVRDCRRAGFRVMHYRGRNFWRGPAVVTDDVHDVVRATQVKVQWDNMGLGYVVYPRH